MPTSSSRWGCSWPSDRGSERLAAAIVVAGLAASLGGCMLGTMRDQNAEIDRRIDAKGRVLSAEERSTVELADRSAALRTELRDSVLSLAQIRMKLDELQRANEAAAATTPQAREKKVARTRQLQAAQVRVLAVEKDPGPTTQERERRRTAVRDETVKMLDLLFLG